jgi:hypothetical protein
MSMNVYLSRIVVVLLVTVTFCLAARVVLKDWRTLGIYVPVGDEPRNLIVARSIFVDHSVEVTRAVRHEQQSKQFFSNYLNGDTGIRSYPKGMFTPHGLALPAYIALPLGYLGREGARYAMVAITAIVAGAAAWLAMFYTGAPLMAFAAATATTVAMPFVPAAGQFYPDIPGGAICLLALIRLIHCRDQPISKSDIPIQLLIATLPWWHIRFSAAALILVAGTLILRPRSTRSIAMTCIPLVVSLLSLCAYNIYAFDNVAGIYKRGEMEISTTSAMVLFGLLIDQNHGLLVQNPVFLVGAFFFPAFIRFDWRVGLIVLAVFAALLVPNAFHINWYGGASISGRFQWAATTVFVLPTIFGLTRLAKINELWFVTIVAAAAWLQDWYFSLYANAKVSLFNRSSLTVFQDYSIFFPKIRHYLPALYDARWAYGFLPNYVFATALILLLGLGVRYALRQTHQPARMATDGLLRP